MTDPTTIGHRCLHWVNGREVELVSVANNGAGPQAVYRYVNGDPPGDGHQMCLDRWLWMSKGGTAPSGKKYVPGAKVRQR